MKDIKQVFNEAEVTSLKPGDRVMVRNLPATRRTRVLDGGVEYALNNQDRTISVLTIRTYQLKNGGIIPFHYSEKIVSLDKKLGEDEK